MEYRDAPPLSSACNSRPQKSLNPTASRLAQGLAVFDAEHRLIAWNQEFVAAIGLPEESVRAGTPFSALISLPNVGHPSETLQYEQTGPGDRILAVRHEPLFVEGRPGGIQSTYTDITETRAAETELRDTRDLLKTILDNIPCGISLTDREQRLILGNPAFLELLGAKDDLENQPGALLPSLFLAHAKRDPAGHSDPERLASRLLALAHTPRANQSSQGPMPLDIHGISLPNGQLLTIYTDTSERHASAERDQLAQKVFTHSPTGIIFTDDMQRIVSINPAITRMTGYEVFELTGHTVLGFLNTDGVHTANMVEELAGTGSWSAEVDFISKSGKHIPVGIRANRVDDPQTGLPAHYIWIVADITERRTAEERMRHIAQHDALTGLPNRLALQMRIAQLLPEARRHQWRVATLFLDLDRFKIINDTLGHQVGDELLREVASRLSNVVRETDFVARLGGDEFLVILPAINTPSDAAVIATKIIAALSAPIEAEGHELHTSPSIGISIFPEDGPDGDTILKNADTAMYHAKNAGRNNYQFFAPEMNQSAADRLDIERKLRHAITRNELSLCFQPQFRADNGRPTGVEALARWHHPKDGLISPARFIPVAEEAGIIVEIGEWVLHNACLEVRRWLDAGLPPIRLAVNVSARQLRRRDFSEAVAGALAQSGLPPELLELEITESSVMENPQEAIEILQRLRRMGVSLAIDDFGTGYSSLAYLKLFPIDHLKIDRSFVADIETDLNDRAIALGTIALARSLGLNVIAEGVETADQLELLRTNGCDEVQGYLFSKPLSSAAAFAFLHALTATE